MHKLCKSTTVIYSDNMHCTFFSVMSIKFLLYQLRRISGLKVLDIEL